MKKYLELYPSVTYNDVTYFTKINEKLTSLCVLYRDVFLNHSQLDLFVHGNASCGKSSLIDSLKIFFIKNKILYYYINLSHLNNSPKLLAQTQKEMSDLSEEFVIVLDGYDELYDKDAILFINDIVLKKCNISKKFKSIIVSSRTNPQINKNETKEGADAKKVYLFDKYNKVIVNEYTVKQTENILLNHQLDVSVFSSATVQLLRNTMLMSLLLNVLHKKGLKAVECLANAGSEGSFLNLYFTTLFEEKNNNKVANTYLFVVGKALYHYFFRGIKSQHKINIPIELSTLFKQVKTEDGYVIVYNNIRFANFAIAIYLYSEMFEYIVTDVHNTDVINKLSFLDCDFFIFREALVYLGDMLKTHKHSFDVFKNIDRIINRKNTLQFINIVFVFLGYNNGVLNDYKDNGCFDLGGRFLNVAAKHNFFLMNPFLKVVNSKYLCNFTLKDVVADSEVCSFELIVPDSVKKIEKNAFATIGDCVTRIKIGSNVAYIGECAFGESHKKIRSIEVSEKNRRFKVINNCLMNKDTVVLCANNAQIPNSVKSISSYAIPQVNHNFYIPNDLDEIGVHDGFIGIDSMGKYIVCPGFDDSGYQLHKKYSLCDVASLLDTNISGNGIIMTVMQKLEESPYNYMNVDGEVLQETSSSIDLKMKFDIEDNVIDLLSSFGKKGVYLSKLIIYREKTPIMIIGAVDSSHSVSDAEIPMDKYYRRKREDFEKHKPIIIITNGSDIRIGKLYEDYIKYFELTANVVDARGCFPPKPFSIYNGLCSFGKFIDIFMKKEILLELFSRTEEEGIEKTARLMANSFHPNNTKDNNTTVSSLNRIIYSQNQEIVDARKRSCHTMIQNQREKRGKWIQHCLGVICLLLIIGLALYKGIYLLRIIYVLGQNPTFLEMLARCVRNIVPQASIILCGYILSVLIINLFRMAIGRLTFVQRIVRKHRIVSSCFLQLKLAQLKTISYVSLE